MSNLPHDWDNARTQPVSPHPSKRHPVVVYVIAAVVLVALCSLGGIAAIAVNLGDDGPKAKAPAVGNTVPDKGVRPTPNVPTATPSPSPAPTVKPSPTPKPKPTITDGVWQVGEDIPAGTYRAAENVSGMSCYWAKYADSEGNNILSNDLPSGGRPQVTLKKGQWFNTERCGTWVRK